MSAPRSRFGLAAASGVALLLAVSACSGGEDPRPRIEAGPEDRPERTLEEAGWDTLFTVGGSVGDTTLLHPVEVAADSAGVSVYDAGRHAIVRFGRNGSLHWTFGGPGAGPGEFSRVDDLELDAHGRTWALDPETARITVVSPTGELVRMVPLDAVDERAARVIPLPGGRAVLFLHARRRPLAVVDGTGRVLDRRAFPWDDFSELPPLATQVESDRAPGEPAWALAFAMGDGFFGFDSVEELGYHGWYVEPIAFPRVVVSRSEEGDRTSTTREITDPEFAAQSVSVADGMLAVLFVGKGEHPRRLLDLYRLKDGRYRASLLLPRAATNVDLADGIAYATFAHPVPGLTALRLPEDGLALEPTRGSRADAAPPTGTSREGGVNSP